MKERGETDRQRARDQGEKDRWGETDGKRLIM